MSYCIPPAVARPLSPARLTQGLEPEQSKSGLYDGREGCGKVGGPLEAQGRSRLWAR